MRNDHGVHRVENLPRLKAIIGAGKDLTVRLPLRAARVTERKSSGEERLALLSCEGEDCRPHKTLLGINLLNELTLKRAVKEFLSSL
jgi:hypothetical protein